MENLIRKYFQDSFEESLLAELETCQIMRVPAGTELRHEADSRVRYTPLVLEGGIKVTRLGETGREILLYFIKPQESCFLNIAAALDQNFSSIDALRAVAESPTTMLAISDAQIRDWHNRYQGWRDYVAQIYNARFAEFFSIIDNVVFKSVDQKLIEKLRELSRGKDEIIITHQELAVQIGSVREVVSRLLKTLENEGIVKLSFGKIKILSTL